MADVSARPARLGDVEAMTALQLRSWDDALGLPSGTGRPDPATATRMWERSVIAPPSARHAVWVATAGEVVVGLAAVAPAADPDLDETSDTELLLLTVDPDWRNQGHGSRLLSATMESLSSHDQLTAVTWVTAKDDDTRSFLEKAGWGVDGAHRSLAQNEEDPPELRLRQLRLGTDLSAANL